MSGLVGLGMLERFARAECPMRGAGALTETRPDGSAGAFLLNMLYFIGVYFPCITKVNSLFSVVCFYPSNAFLSIFMLTGMVPVQYLFLIVC